MTRPLDFTTNLNFLNTLSSQPIPVNASPVTREIVDIQNLLNSSTVCVNLIGIRYLVGSQGSSNMDSIAERLKIVSRNYQSFNETDRATGIDCLNKMRAFYTQSDAWIFAKIRNVFDASIAVICLPITVFRLWCGHYPKYSQRECIEGDGMYSIGPESIEMNFWRTR